ncbi:hemerythrin domain-containing protein [bacterium]|nr:MAG: hemerythrin domain-containing protein [bacterium]
MDKILRHAREHGEIFEALSFFNKAASVAEGKKALDSLPGINRLFSRDIANHLRFEESRIFSLVLNNGGLKDKCIIRALQHEHIDILEKIDEFKELFAGGSFAPEDKQRAKGLVELSREIINMMLTHSRKEDRELFPVFKRLGYSLEGKEKA